ncbi:MAG: VOC family protein [Bacteroidetes bacterium]|nr:VOC family protein [Bacteroidota bacterium]
MQRISHFELLANDPARAESFYSNVFGWTFTKWDGPMDYWMIATGTEGPGIDGGMGRRNSPEERANNVIDVPSFDEWAARIAANGGTQTVPKSAVPGVGYLGYFRDTEGNEFGLIQFDAAAGS